MDRYRLHPIELSGLLKITLDQALALFRGEQWSVPALERSTVTGKTVHRQVAVADFVDVTDNYAVLALEAIKQLAAGEDPEPFEI